MKKRKIRRVKDFVLPHKGNGYKPLALTAGGVALALILIVLIQGVYVLGSRFAFSNPHFLASVLPSVVTGLTNDDRHTQGLKAVDPDALLTKAAQMKAEDMAEKGYFSHVAPDGKTPWYWLDQVKYPYTYAGENLAIDFTDSKDVEDAWMASPTHRANIVKPQYTRIGIGVAKGMYEGHETTFVVQFFATPKAGVIIPGESTIAVQASKSRVLGAEITPLLPVSFADFFARIAASPTHTITYVLAGIAGLFLLLLLIAVFVHIRFQFIEVIVGGLLVVSAVLIFMVWNNIQSSGTVTPQGSETAATHTQ